MKPIFGPAGAGGMLAFCSRNLCTASMICGSRLYIHSCWAILNALDTMKYSPTPAGNSM
jgi:hypothetical protein